MSSVIGVHMGCCTSWMASPFPELYEDDCRLPLCDHLAAAAPAGLRPDLLIIHHLHERALPFIRALGRAYPIRKIIGVPYSSVPTVIRSLAAEYDVTVPQDLEEIAVISRVALEASDKPLIIEEIGGYTSAIASLIESRSVLGVVEDTAHGHWRWQQATERHAVRVLSVASAKLKHREHVLVAKAIIDGTAKLLHQRNLPPLSDMTVLVIGYGRLGSQVSAHLRPLCKQVVVHDQDGARQAAADVSFGSSSDWRKVNLVIGVTGNPAHGLRHEQIRHFAPGVVLVSGSSRQTEFDIPAMRSRCSEADEADPHLWRYRIDDKDVFVANRGEPINFRYSRVPSSALDLTYGALVYCINRLAEHTNCIPVGVNELQQEDEHLIAQAYEMQYARKL